MKHSSHLSKKIAIFSSSAILLITSCKKNVDESTASARVQSKAITTYQLVWSDEFNGTRVKTSNWNFETGGGGWGNNEDEYYQKENATVSNGKLMITARKETINGYNYTSARITTQGKREFKYGKIEARIKLPVAQGLWPAFWMLGANINNVGWPACGETDIMEHINIEKLIYGTIHWLDANNMYASYGGNITTTPGKYHVYSIEWDSAAIRWYVDGVKYHEASILNNINGTDEFHKRFFILLNVAVGGDWPGHIIDDSKLPANMYVDYVRVYQAL